MKIEKELRLKLTHFLIVSLIFFSCAKPDVEYFVGDYKNEQIVSETKSVSAKEPEFNDYICMHFEDSVKLHNWIRANCKYSDRYNIEIEKEYSNYLAMKKKLQSGGR